MGARYVQASRAATLAMSRIGAATTRRFANRWVMGAARAAEMVSIRPTLAIGPCGAAPSVPEIHAHLFSARHFARSVTAPTRIRNE
ncbi:hypothetical protein MyChFU_08930 [Mycobacterium intracellulare subsp. chimaera]